jgi:general secretion pathway protein M
MSALTNLQSQLSGSLATLSGRERRMVLIGGLALGVFLIFMVTMGFSNKAAAIRRRTTEKVLKLDEVQALAANYNQQKANQDALERQLAASNVRLMSYLEDKAKKAGIELQSQNPKADVPLEGSKIIESGVELTLTDIKLNRLVDFLAAVEAGPGIVKVKYLRLEPRVASETITAWLIVSTYHLK